jgi:transposase-like protein
MRRLPVLAVAATACVAAVPLVALDAPAWARFPAVLLVLALAPGTALLLLLGQRIEVGLAVGVSLAVSVAIAQGMLWAGAWHPKLFACLLAGVCLACMAAARLRPPGRPWLRRRASSGWSAVRATPRRGWDLVRHRQRAARLVPLREPAGSSDVPREARIASIRVRTRGDPAALALALRALLSLEGGRGAKRDGGEPDAQEPPLVLRPAPRRFSAEYKLQILREAEACTRKGELTELLRREGLGTSHLTAWRKKRDEGALTRSDREPDDAGERTRPQGGVIGLTGELQGPGAARRAGR